MASGAAAAGYAVADQNHAPMPAASAAGTLGPARAPSAGQRPEARTASRHTHHSTPVVTAPVQLPRSLPVSISIPAIGVDSVVQDLGVNANGTIQVPPLGNTPQTNEAAWFKYSATPGQVGVSVIEGHIDSVYQGPSVFFELGKLVPGDLINVTLADHVVAQFTVNGVREYDKTEFPTSTFYANAGFAALHLVTCGGAFDPTTHQYLSNIIVFASLTASYPLS